MSTLDVVSIETPNLGDRSYVVGRNGYAVVIDPQRDVDRVQRIVDERRWQVTHVLETHFHNDYVSGGLELSRVLSAEYVVPSGMDISFPAHRIGDKAEIAAETGLLRVIHTPGHTPNHLSYALNVEGQDLAVFTGGSLLFGSVGRPDLLGPELTEPLARAQWKSMRRLAADVSQSAQVYPTHGFGSFCSATATVGTASTIGEQLAANPAFSTDEDVFVSELIAGLDAFPAYYAQMGPANQTGAGPIDLSLPKLATAQDIAHSIEAGEWVVDLRHRRIFSAEHIKGSLSFDVHGNAVTYLGWLIDWGTPITLIGADAEEVVAWASTVLLPTPWARGPTGRQQRLRSPATRTRVTSRWLRPWITTRHFLCLTSVATVSTTMATSPARSTFRSTNCADESKRSLPGPRETWKTGRYGSTAAAGSEPPWRPRFSMRPALISFTSMTTSRTQQKPAYRSVPRPLVTDSEPCTQTDP
jgi:hydroxyacylglutathione hydrolase